jgi:2-oxoisovalerate dehydrogenase E1 component alpha subunit
VLAAQLLHATGYAIGAQLDGADEIVLAYFGDGASSEGDANEALNWAAVTSAPVLFFCQNNQWAISTATSLQMRAPLHQRAQGFGLEGYVVDGNDVLAVYALTRQVSDAVRQGGGPALIEAVTYRMGGHSTADDPTRYRTSGEVESWGELDPITRLGRLMETSGWADDAFWDQLTTECEELAIEMRRVCLGIEPASIDQLYACVYAAEPQGLSREREELRTYLDSFEG